MLVYKGKMDNNKNIEILKRFINAIGNARNLKKSEISEIGTFFSDLRGHWQMFYHKTISNFLFNDVILPYFKRSTI